MWSHDDLVFKTSQLQRINPDDNYAPSSSSSSSSSSSPVQLVRVCIIAPAPLHPPVMDQPRTVLYCTVLPLLHCTIICNVLQYLFCIHPNNFWLWCSCWSDDDMRWSASQFYSLGLVQLCNCMIAQTQNVLQCAIAHICVQLQIAKHICMPELQNVSDMADISV